MLSSMRKIWLIILIAILLLVAGIILGIYVYQKNQSTQDSNLFQNQLAYQKQEQENQENVLTTVAMEEKTSPNSQLVEKQYFKGCDHIIKKVEDMPQNCINCTKQEIANQYSNWQIEKFSSEEVVLYQEQEGFCSEHYVVREHNGVLSIYTIDENGIETWKEDTEIVTMYLPEIDLQRVKEGIKVIGESKLRTVLEDFE